MDISKVWAQVRGSREAEGHRGTRRELVSDMLLGFGAAIALGSLFVLAYLSAQYQAYRNPYFAVAALICVAAMAVGSVMLICGRLLDR
ncbi:MAG: hypothetical protein HYY29_02220 [Chloroflexi bacterium]|nr:hypothetical protein [Chloroflexota bacterium]